MGDPVYRTYRIRIDNLYDISHSARNNVSDKVLWTPIHSIHMLYNPCELRNSNLPLKNSKTAALKSGNPKIIPGLNLTRLIQIKKIGPVFEFFEGRFEFLRLQGV